MFELVQCKAGAIVHETLTFDGMLERFKSTHAEGSVNTWSNTCRTGDVLELSDVNIIIVCIE